MFKLILVGFVAVGKSNILLKYTRDQFNEESQSTIGVEYATKTITTSQGTRIKLQIWDTAGQERFRTITNTYYKSKQINKYRCTCCFSGLRYHQSRKL